MTFVSVLLPVYNGTRYLERAAGSILQQTHRDLELIVLDDGSTDGSGAMAEALGDSRVRVIRSERNQGLATTLNRGLREARGSIVARQDADDLSHPRRLEKQVAFLESNRDIGLLGSQAWLMDERGHCFGVLEHACGHESLVWELSFDNAFVHSSVAFRRDAALTGCGGYDESWAYNQDYDLWLRLAPRTRLANLPERLVALRSHRASMTQTMGAESATANRLLLARSLSSVLGEMPADAVELVARAREGMDVSDLRRLLPLLENWVGSYRAFLTSESQADFRRTVARQYLQLAFTRRGRTARRIILALWAARHFGGELTREFLGLATIRSRLLLGYEPLASFQANAL